MKGMRSSLSMLTGASAQLATALEKRNQEYDASLARQDEFNRRLQAVQTELNLASAERSNFKEQVNERNAHLIDIQGRLDHLQSELETVAASKAALETQLAGVKDELERRSAEIDGLTAKQAEMVARLESATAAESATEESCSASQAQLADLNDQLTALGSELQAALPAVPGALPTGGETVHSDAPQVVIEDIAPQAPGVRPAAGISAVAAVRSAPCRAGKETDVRRKAAGHHRPVERDHRSTRIDLRQTAGQRG